MKSGERGGAGGGGERVAPALEGLTPGAVGRDELVLAKRHLARVVEASVDPVHDVVRHEEDADEMIEEAGELDPIGDRQLTCDRRG